MSFDRKAYMREYMRSYMTKYREENREKINEQARDFTKRHPDKIRIKNAQKKYYKLRYAWKDRNPEKTKAHNAVNAALQSGQLTKPDKCTNCHKVAAIHGHHPDYSKQLDIIWLCVRCHTDVHMFNRKERVLA